MKGLTYLKSSAEISPERVMRMADVTEAEDATYHLGNTHHQGHHNVEQQETLIGRSFVMIGTEKRNKSSPGVHQVSVIILH